MVLVVGIAGGSASGKTTVARMVSEHLGRHCVLIAHDRYYRAAAGPRTNFDHPEALDTEHLLSDLERLRAHHPTRLPVYDFATHDRAPPDRWDPVDPRPVLVVEGILVLAIPALRDVFDLRVFVEAPDDIRLVRRVRRDVAHRGRTVHSVLDQYERTVRPMHQAYVAPSRAHADLVLDGTEPPRREAQRVLEWLHARLPSVTA